MSCCVRSDEWGGMSEGCETRRSRREAAVVSRAVGGRKWHGRDLRSREEPPKRFYLPNPTIFRGVTCYPCESYRVAVVPALHIMTFVETVTYQGIFR